MQNTKRQPPIAVVGVAALFPGSIDRDGFWRDILAGRDLVTEVPPTHWLIDDYYDADPSAPDKTYAKRGAFLPQVDFDPVAWGLPPSSLPATDTTQVLALIVAQQVLQDACGSQWKSMPRDRVSVILGVTSAQELLGSMVSRLQRPIWVKALREMGLPESQVIRACDRIAAHYVPWQESSFPGLLGNVVAGRIANRLDLGGTNCITDAACASSFSALSMAVSELHLGQSDLVIAGGADTMNDIFMYMCFSKTPALSPSGDCRPFSDQADGTLLGEGIGMVALKRLQDAERDGDRIYALITGIGSSSDGRSKSVYAPVPAGQARALRRAFEQAGYGPDTVELVEAHGTGTKAGDAAEFEALRTVFEETGRPDRGWCALGSVKSQVGHTKAAAGAAGLFKAVMALHHKVLPPTIKIQRPDPKLALETSPFHLNTLARPWIRDSAHPRRAGVSSFGFGGSNFHVALQEYTGPCRHARTAPLVGHLLLLSAATPADLAQKCVTLALDVAMPGLAAFLARSSQDSFDPTAAARLSIFADSSDDLAAKLRQAGTLCSDARTMTVPGGIDLAFGTGATDLAFLFPGQGSQYLRMGADVAMAFDAARSVWDGLDAPDVTTLLHDVVFPRPAFDDEGRRAQEQRLVATQWAQPAIGATSLSYLAILNAIGIHAAAVAGHSFGEVTALHAAGVFAAKDLMRLARRRGEVIAEAATTPGAMLSVAAPLDVVHAFIETSGLPIVLANHNSPRQAVLSGPTAAIVDAEKRLVSQGLTVTRLDVATAFHSPVVSSASAPLRAFLDGVPIEAPRIPVFANATAAPYPTDPNKIRTTLADQVALPVRFVEQVEALYARGIHTFVEVGPGHVLTALVGHILKDRPHRAVAVDRKGRPGTSTLLQTLGALSVAGVPVSYETLWASFDRPIDPRLVPKPAMTLKVGGANLGKPYPPPGGGAALPKPNPEPIPVPAAPTQAASIDPSVQLAWIQAFSENQRQTAEAHTAFARAMGDAHAAFLRSSEASLFGLASLMGDAPPRPAVTMPSPAPMAPAPVAVSAPIVKAPIPAPPSQLMRPAPSRPAVVARPLAPAPTAPAPALPVAAPTTNATTLSIDSLQELIIDVVAKATGYPPDMLGLDMDIEADLGVDSIKRVEILSAMTARAPGLPEVSAARMAALRTLREIVAALGSALTSGPPPGHTNGKANEKGNGAALGKASGLDQRATALTRQGLHTVAKPAVGLTTAGLWGARRLVVTDDGGGVGAALVQRLLAWNPNTTLVTEVPPDADAVIVLHGLRTAFDLAGALAINRTVFQAARAVAANFGTKGGSFIAVQDSGGDFGLSGNDRAWTSGAAALCRTARLEWPGATIRAIDLEQAGRSALVLADVIATELLSGGTAPDVGLRATGERLILEPHAAPLGLRAKLPVQPVVVASGGARGVTSACLIALAQDTQARVLLLGRSRPSPEPSSCTGLEKGADIKRALLADARARGESPSPAELAKQEGSLRANREIRSTIAAIESAGGAARYVALDVTDHDAVRDAVATVRKDWGPVTGVVHGAGVLADKLISEKTDAQFDRVLQTKLAGLHALLSATRGDDLAFLTLFSSVAARSGNLGQADYAMANEILNRVAIVEQRKRGATCVVRSLGWGPWDGGMVDDGLRARFATLGVPLIPVSDGARAFVNDLCSPGSDVDVVVGGAQGLMARSAPHAVTCDIIVDRATYPFLSDHRIKNTAVVPVALVLEWFARAAHLCRPDLTLGRIRAVKVLRGIRLRAFDTSSDRFQIHARQLSNGDGATLAVELTDTEGVRLYTATVEVLDRPPGLTNPGLTHGPSVLAPPLTSSSVIYGQAPLFHGPLFQVVRTVEHDTPLSIRATVEGVNHKKWPGSWQLDPALLDGALQLALLWTQQILGRSSLPTSVETIHIHVTGPIATPATALLTGREAAHERGLCDVAFQLADGTIVAEVLGIETHLLAATQTTSQAAIDP